MVSFSTEEELIDQIKLYQPDIMVIGSDYKNRRIIGAEHVGKIVYFNRLDDISTTSILEYGKNTSDRRALL